jgi:two-component system sensor histidine kinase CiaH
MQRISKNIFKPFTDWVINLKNNNFSKARFKLTLFYAASLFIVVVVFSTLIYILFINNIINNNEFEGDQYSEPSAFQEFQILNAATNKLKLVLIFTDIGILIIVSGAGYFLAGKTLNPIKKTLEEQKRFVSDSAHELRTPLTIMKTGIETVSAEKRQSLKEYQELSQDLLEEINKLIIMSNDLLFLTNKDTEKPEKILAGVNISLICEKQIKLFQPYAAKKTVLLVGEIKGQFYLKGNEEQLNQLIRNLLKNAIDYNSQSGKVSLSLEKQKNNIILKVMDTGIGIDAEDLKHIYKRFYKADRARSLPDSGAGLGLSIVKEIVDFHKGLIKINSNPGEGTEVIIVFPAL